MLNEHLKSAQQKLLCDGVFIRGSSVNFDPSFRRDRSTSGQPLVEHMRNLIKVEVSKPSNGDGPLLYEFTLELGVRVVTYHEETVEKAQQNPEDSETSELAPLQTYAQIEAKFLVAYRSDVELTKEEVEAFATKNVFHHPWSYWREFVQNTCTRADLPIITIPFFFAEKT